MSLPTPYLLTPCAPSRVKAAGRALRVPPGIVARFELVHSPGSPHWPTSQAGMPAAYLETLVQDSTPFLILVLPRRAWRSVLVNGSQALPVQVLRVGDVLRCTDGIDFEVSLDRVYYVGRARPGDVGRPCPVCRAGILPGTTVFACVSCQSVMHLGGDDVPPGNRLARALVPAACPCCSLPMPHDVQEGRPHAPAS